MRIKLTPNQIGLIETEEWTNPEYHANYLDPREKRAWIGFMCAYDEETQSLDVSDPLVAEQAREFVDIRLEAISEQCEAGYAITGCIDRRDEQSLMALSNKLWRAIKAHAEAA